VVSIRPLSVEELAEVLAVDLGGADEAIPKLKPDWRWEDQEEALQTACSSLIAIVDTGHSRVVQFSHFSVKEFLTSPRLADSSRDVSRYHIPMEPAHTILAKSCFRRPAAFGRWYRREEHHESVSSGWICCSTLGRPCPVRKCVVTHTQSDGTSF
jgi:hypothetical protein